MPTMHTARASRFYLLLIALCITAVPVHGQSDRYCVLASAAVQENPPQIIFSWPLDPGTPGFPLLDYKVYRKSKSSGDWGNPIATLADTATGFTDTNVAIGQTYEYQFIKHATNLTGYGYIWSGIRAPLIEDRGTIVLLVDDLFSTDLTNELARLQQDLVGDGWSVIRHDVSRAASVPSVRSLLISDWKHYPNVRAAFLFGHIPVPYAGNITPDDKPDHHKGAWPADVYYAELNGFWTDFAINNTTAQDSRNWNTPFDGKYDQSVLSSDVELQVGRVDLANMPGKYTYDGDPTFLPEKELLRQYLNKDHAYRYKMFVPASRGLIHDGAGARDGVAAAATVWRACSAFYGASNIVEDTDESFLQRTSTNSYQWAFASDAGDFSSLGRMGGSGNFGAMTTAEMCASNIQASFVCFIGSWLGDWDNTDDLLRGVLATPSNGLACAFGGVPHWFFHHMALGENIGYSARLSQNNYSTFYKNQISAGSRMVHAALMGDPTLRLQMPAPPLNLSASGTSNVLLNWSASVDATLGYHIYRSPSPNGYFTRITSSPISGTTFTDFSAARGTNAYMVRALKLETNGSGTFTNISQGTLAIINASNTPLPAPKITAQYFAGAQSYVQALGPAGLHYTLLASTNLVNWESVASLWATNSPFDLADPASSNFNARYYQVSVAP
jgi:hypothetical protein